MSQNFSPKTSFILITALALAVSRYFVACKTLPEDEYIDKLLKEFHNSIISTPKTSGSVVTNNKEKETDGNQVPINEQSMYFKQENCTCEKFYLCDVENKDEKSQEDADSDYESGANLDLINIRINVPEGACPHYLDICCDKVKQTVGPPFIPQSKCGKRHDRGVGFRITGHQNNEAQFGEFGWMTAIIETKPPKKLGGKSTKSFICGASLIHPSVVLTAAHCLRNKTANHLQVRVGEWDTQTTSELYPHEDIDVDLIIVHENFQMVKNLINDIALLVLKFPAKLAPNVSPVCLPQANTNMNGKRCFATGWGTDNFEAEGVYQTILKKVDLPIISHELCQTKLRNTALGIKFLLHPSFICAGDQIDPFPCNLIVLFRNAGGEKGSDTCKGDGGSPLVCEQSPGSGYFLQYGIVSWGIGCGRESIPAVYVNVPYFADWIEENLTLLGLSMSVRDS